MTLSHLDAEQLSALLDEEAGPEQSAHVQSCAACAAKLETLGSVASQLQEPVNLPIEPKVDAAVHAAREAWKTELDSDGEKTLGPVVALDERRRPPRWLLPVAAAAVAVLAAVPVIASLNDRDPAQTAATADRDESGGRQAEVAEADGGDLGDQSDPTALGQAVRGALPGAVSESALAAPSPAPLSGGATQAPPPAADQTGQPRVATNEQAEANAFRTTKGSTAAPCTTTVRSTYGKGLGPLVYSAAVRWQGTPAIVLGYRLVEAGAPGLDYRVLVMALQDCRLLVVQSL